MVACRHFSPEEYTDVDKCLNAARTALQQREERLQEAFSYVERDLQLLGATGVEDKYVVQNHLPFPLPNFNYIINDTNNQCSKALLIEEEPKL